MLKKKEFCSPDKMNRRESSGGNHGTGAQPTSAGTKADKEVAYVPILRGYVHLTLVLLSPVLIAWLVKSVVKPKLMPSYILAFCCCVLNFAASAVLHFRMFDHLGCDIDLKLDYAHAGIFLMIGGSALPSTTVLVINDLSVLTTLIQWLGVAVGIETLLPTLTRPAGIVASMAFNFVTAPAVSRVVIYFAVASPYFHVCYTLYQIKCFSGLICTATTLILYFIGGIIYANKAPNPIPNYLGFHELFHLCCALALVTTFVGNHKITNFVCND
uniref:Hemolysin III n=1 Tax=Babesia divergens TaxID=32595 RepID=A0A6M4RW15_BABDI|nr:hemolysin III [Babesia divergens]